MKHAKNKKSEVKVIEYNCPYCCDTGKLYFNGSLVAQKCPCPQNT